MAEVPLLKDFSALKNKTLVITGGARGIGHGLVQLARENGVNVVFGDLNEDLGQEVASKTGAVFVKTDVTNYGSLLALFDEALSRFGTINHVVANAALYEPRGVFDKSLDMNSVREEPSLSLVDINVKSVLQLVRIASVYLRQNSKPEDEKSITIMTSLAAFLCPADTPAYVSTKAATVGLVRALSPGLSTTHGIKVNGVCPSLVETPLVQPAFISWWKERNLPINSPTDIAKVVLTLCASGMNGKLLGVDDARAFALDEPIRDLAPQWMGPVLWKSMEKTLSSGLLTESDIPHS